MILWNFVLNDNTANSVNHHHNTQSMLCIGIKNTLIFGKNKTQKQLFNQIKKFSPPSCLF